MLPELHDSLFDSWLLQNFPGRTLDELDNMDVLRYMRALEARSLETTDGMRRQVQKKGGGKVGDELTKEQWKEILDLDKLVEEYKQRFKDG